MSASPLWKRLAQVISWYLLQWVIMLGLLTHFLPGLSPIVLIPLLWWANRPGCPLKPKLPEQDFSRVEWWLWYGGAAVCGLLLPACAYSARILDGFESYRAMGIGVASWAFLFLCSRDCRRVQSPAGDSIQEG